MDYCASAWYGPGKWGTLSLLRNMEKVQRIGAQAIILSFRATALTVAQAEAGIESTVARLQRKVANHLVRSLTVPNTNPLFECLTRLYTHGKSFPSPLTVTTKQFGPSIGFAVDSLMETVEPVLQEPWMEGILGCSTNGSNHEEEVVLRRLQSKGPREEKRTVYTDAACKDGEGGIAVVQGLTLADLLDTDTHSGTPFVAFLSACKTGRFRDERVVDEGLHLVNSFQLAGFRHAIWTLWEVGDQNSMEIAQITDAKAYH